MQSNKNVMRTALVSAIAMGAAVGTPSAANAQAQARSTSVLEKPFSGRDAKAFSPVGKNFEHWLTSARCPTQIGDMPIKGLSQYYLQGHSVSCRYSNGSSSKIDFNIRTFNKDETTKSFMENAIKRFQASGKVANVGSTQQVRMDFGGQDIACLKTELTMQPLSNGTKISEVFTACNAMRWLFTIVEGGNASEKAKRASLGRALMASQTQAKDHLNTCVAMTKARNAMKPSEATGLNIAVDRFGYTQKGVPCFSGNIAPKEGREGLLLISWPENPDTPIGIHTVSSTGDISETPHFRLQDMWAGVPADERGEGGYIMIKEDADGTLSSYGGFLRIVLSGRVYGQYLKALSGELKPRTVSKPAGGGGKQITIG